MLQPATYDKKMRNCVICAEESFRFCTLCAKYYCNEHLCSHLGEYNGRLRTDFELQSEERSGNHWLSNRVILSSFTDKKLKEMASYYKEMSNLCLDELKSRSYGNSRSSNSSSHSRISSTNSIKLSSENSENNGRMVLSTRRQNKTKSFGIESILKAIDKGSLNIDFAIKFLERRIGK